MVKQTSYLKQCEITCLYSEYEPLLAFLSLIDTGTFTEEIIGDHVIWTLGFETSLEEAKSMIQEWIDSLPAHLSGPRNISWTEVEKRNWALEFQKSLPQIQLTPKLKLEVEGYYEGQIDQSMILIKYGMAFGTGEHETSQLCSKLIEEVLQENKIDKICDLGCGTGILSLVAYKNGVSKITAIDNDVTSLEVAQETFELNQFQGEVQFLNSINDSKESFPLFVANILLNPLLELKETIINHLQKEAFLILSGITREQCPQLIRAYSELELIKTVEDKSWSALLLKRTGS